MNWLEGEQMTAPEITDELCREIINQWQRTSHTYADSEESIRRRVAAKTSVTYIVLAANHGAQLAAEVLRLRAIIRTVDDVLVVHWCLRDDGDYKEALEDLIRINIEQSHDPRISQAAADREAELKTLRDQNWQLREKLKLLDAIRQDAREEVVELRLALSERMKGQNDEE